MLQSIGSPLEDVLFPIEFTTIFDYMVLLRAATRALAPAGNQAMLLLAAAVSDFYLPENEMATDKIQSSSAGLSLQLGNVPKVLSCVKQDDRAWAPQCFMVSFKLETNPNILKAKAAGAIMKYGMDLVVANELGRHTNEVQLISHDERKGALQVMADTIEGNETSEIPVEGVAIRKVSLGAHDGDAQEVEQLLVAELVGAHEAFLASH